MSQVDLFFAFSFISRHEMQFLIFKELSRTLSFLLFFDFSLAADLIIMEGVSLAGAAGFVGNAIRMQPVVFFALLRTKKTTTN